MKQLKVIFHEAAVFDLEDVWHYTVKTWSVEQADRYHKLLFSEIEFLSQKPNSGKSISHVRPGYYSSKVKSHLLFYTFSKSELEIIRILNESIDIPNRI